ATAATGGRLLVSTSPRTPLAAADAAIKAVTCRNFIYRWEAGDPDNPYHAFLALADRFIVTADSASLLVEACLMGKPVEILSWPMRRGPLLRLKDWLWSRYGTNADSALAVTIDRLGD